MEAGAPKVRSVFSADGNTGMLEYAGVRDSLRLPCSGIKIKSLSWYGAAGKILHRGRSSPQGELCCGNLSGGQVFLSSGTGKGCVYAYGFERYGGL